MNDFLFFWRQLRFHGSARRAFADMRSTRRCKRWIAADARARS
jgi:hypothetical protein